MVILIDHHNAGITLDNMHQKIKNSLNVRLIEVLNILVEYTNQR